MLDLSKVTNAKKAFRLMDCFNETASLLKRVKDAGFKFKTLKGDFGAVSGIADAVNKCIYYKKGEYALSTIVHEALHVEQFLNSALLTRSLHFYSGVPFPEDLMTAGDVDPVLSPAAMVEAIVLMEVSVIQAQNKILYNLAKHLDVDCLPMLDQGLASMYKDFLEKKVVALQYINDDGTFDDFEAEMPDDVRGDSEKERYCALNLIGAVTYSSGATIDGELIKDRYAQYFLREIEDLPNLLNHNINVLFVDLDHETVRAIGKIGGLDLYKDFDLWRLLENSDPIKNNPDTASLLLGVERALNIN